MAKDNWKWMLVLIVGLIVVGMFIQKSYEPFVITGSETMERSFDTEVDPGTTLQVTYNVIGASGKWGVSVIDTLSCPGYADQEKKFVMTSDEGTSRIVTYSIPNQYDLVCTFTGDYQFGTEAIKNFATETVTVPPEQTCSYLGGICCPSGTYGQNCIGGTFQTSTDCGDLCCVGGTCVTCNTEADTNCDGVVSRDELGVSITQWLNGEITRIKLGEIIVAWVGTG